LRGRGLKKGSKENASGGLKKSQEKEAVGRRVPAPPVGRWRRAAKIAGRFLPLASKGLENMLESAR